MALDVTQRTENAVWVAINPIGLAINAPGRVLHASGWTINANGQVLKILKWMLNMAGRVPDLWKWEMRLWFRPHPQRSGPRRRNEPTPACVHPSVGGDFENEDGGMLRSQEVAQDSFRKASYCPAVSRFCASSVKGFSLHNQPSTCAD